MSNSLLSKGIIISLSSLALFIPTLLFAKKKVKLEKRLVLSTKGKWPGMYKQKTSLILR